jgi:hypothetical protein
LGHDISFDASGDVRFPRLDTTTHFSVRTNLNDPVQLDIALDFSVTDEVAGPANTAHEAEANAQKVGILLVIPTPDPKHPDLLILIEQSAYRPPNLSNAFAAAPPPGPSQLCKNYILTGGFP